MQIRYVISTMVFWLRENRLSFEQECQFIKSMGFGVELRPTIMGHDECRYNRINWSRLASATEGMLVSMYSRNDDPTLEQWKEQIECAKFLGANIVTDLHSFGIPEGVDIDGCDFSREVVKFAELNDVKICLETGNLTKMKQLGERFDSVRYCLDAGHANLDPVFTFKQYVDELAPRITHLHLTDNYGQADDHLPPGLNGGMPIENWDYLLNALSRYNNEIIASLQMCPTMPAVMLHQGCEFLFDKLNWPDKPKKQLDANIVYEPR